MHCTISYHWCLCGLKNGPSTLLLPALVDSKLLPHFLTFGNKWNLFLQPWSSSTSASTYVCSSLSLAKEISGNVFVSIPKFKAEVHATLMFILRPCKPTSFWSILLLLSGDVKVNPILVTFPCGDCGREVASNHRGICCDTCNQWFHIRCANIIPQEYSALCDSIEDLYCKNCNSDNDGRQRQLSIWRDTMNKQMKSGSTSLLYEDEDIKNKQTNRDSSSLKPETVVQSTHRWRERAAPWNQKIAIQWTDRWRERAAPWNQKTAVQWTDR